MRIFVASGIFPPEIGGPATYLQGLLPELRALGHEVRVLTYGDSDRRATSPEYVATIRRGFLPWRLARYARSYTLGTRWADVALVLSQALPRVVDGGARVLFRVAGDYAWERSINRGWIDPGEGLEEFQATRHSWRVEALKAWRARESRKATRVIVPSEFLRDLVVGWGVDSGRVGVIPNAVRPDADARTLPRAEARRRLGWDDDGRYLLVAARLTPWKGVDFAIDAVAKLPGLRLVIAGDGPARTSLVAQAAPAGEAVTFTGVLAPHTLALHVRAADYVLVYSGYEGLSHTILESLSLGTPVIASRRGGNEEVVVDGVNGLLVDHPDSAALLEALRHGFEPEIHAKLTAWAARPLERFGWQRFVEDTARGLEEVAHGGGASR